MQNTKHPSFVAATSKVVAASVNLGSTPGESTTLRSLFQEPGRHPGNNVVFASRRSDDTACGYDSPPSKGHAGKNGGMGSDPNIVFNHDTGFIRSGRLIGNEQASVYRVVGTDEGRSLGDQALSPDPDTARCPKVVHLSDVGVVSYVKEWLGFAVAVKVMLHRDESQCADDDILTQTDFAPFSDPDEAARVDAALPNTICKSLKQYPVAQYSRAIF